MSHATRLATYIRMIEDFLSGRSAPSAFTEAFFEAFHGDPGGWDREAYDALNWVATACESYSPRAPRSEFDVSIEELRRGCTQRLKELHRLARESQP